MYEPLNLGTHISVRKLTKQEYSAPKDEETGLIEGMGSIIWDPDNYIQSYEGKFIWNNMHGYGKYQWESLGSKYEGQFYTNKKEGYGRFSYPCGAYFEGLYRNDQRFGPGVYTDAAGYQDVGIWVASKLVRLSRCFEPDHVIPRLAVTNADKIKILQYRQIVHLQKDKEKHMAENLLESLTHSRNYDKSVIARAEELYNPFCKDDRAPSLNKPKYDRTFFGNESNQFTIDVLVTEEKEIQQKISNEKRVVIQVESPPSRDILQIHESTIIHNLEDIQMNKEQGIGSKSEVKRKIELLENKGEKGEVESDYCGMEPIDLEQLNDPLLIENHENLWSIFQSSSIMLPRDLPQTPSVNPLNGDSIQKSSSGEKKSSEDEFDDFGRKKIKGMKPLTKKVIVTGLLAWNNSLQLIELLKHVFKHRHFEKTLSFDISKVLAGRRGSFRQKGAHEKSALELLAACSNGLQTEISILILKQNLDPDVADSRGNTGLLLAAAKDRLEVIDVLLDFGANVDSLNDECLTPLSLCILRLLELIHGVTNWPKAFLTNKINDEPIVKNKCKTSENYEQWHGRISYESLTQQMPKQMNSNLLLTENESTELGSDNFSIKYESGVAKDASGARSIAVLKHGQRKELKELGQNRTTQNNDFSDQSHEQKYIFDMRPIIRAPISQKKIKNNPTKYGNNKIEVQTSINDKTIPKDGFAKSEKLSRESKHTQYNNSKIEKVRNTILKLLSRGADPNFSQVPFPVLIMAIFTKIPSLLSQLLEYGADPNTTLSEADHFLTPLLILTILQPANENSLMAKVLLEAKANPSLRTDPDYRPDLMERLSRKRAPEYLDKSQGVTALHLLAIRSDADEHLEALIRVFYKYGCIKSSDLYQGHSPLSLAIVEGNFTAAKIFLRTEFINVNEQLGADLGSAMLMLVSCALQELLPHDSLQKFLELLLEYGGCPFASADTLEEEYNQIEYGRKELTKILTIAGNSMEVKEKRRKSKSNNKESSKTSNEIVIENFIRSMNFVEKIAREKLTRWIKANFVRDMMNSPLMLVPVAKQLSVFLEEPLFSYALNWMTEENLVVVMKSMNCSRDNITKLLRLFVAARALTHRKISSDVNKLVMKETETIMNKMMPSTDQKQRPLASVDLKVEKSNDEKETKNLEPELDLENNKFKVCFECFGVHEKILIACPQCKRLYFCSEECNSKNSEREGNPHQCPIFYQNEWKRTEKVATTPGIDATSYILQGFQKPGKFFDLDVKTRRGEGSSNYRDKSTRDIKAEYTDDEFAVHRRLEVSNYKTINVNDGNQLADKVDHDYDNKEISINRKKVKTRQKILEYQENESEVSTVNKNNKYGDDKKKSQNVGKKEHGFEDNDGITNYVSGEKNASQDPKKSGVNKEEKEKITDGHNVKIKNEKKYQHLLRNNEEVIDDETEMKLERGKKKESVIANGKVAWTGNDNNVQLKKVKQKGCVFDENESDKKSSKYRAVKNLRNKMKDQRANEIRRNDNEIMYEVDRIRKGGYGKREWDNSRNKKTREQVPNTWENTAKIDINNVENNVKNKYLNWLLKINKSVEERLDIDVLLLPYVVFAQGDTYFRILPTYRFPNYKGNYSLI